ncbi:MAG: S1 RNA-binding domain-containing protein, partial [Ignavibacteriales bacterium]
MLELEKDTKKKVSKPKRERYINADEYSPEDLKELSELYAHSFRDIKEGEILEGTIVGVNTDNVVVDVGFKSDGTISKSEFNATEEIKIGEKVDVVIESVDDEDGNLVLSKKRADFLKIWGRVMD